MENSEYYLSTPNKQHKMIVDLSKGLLEITPSDHWSYSPPYQFIHESVRDFFLKGNGFDPLGVHEVNMLGSGHTKIAALCIHFLDLSDFRTMAQAFNGGVERSSQGITDQYLFLQYTGQYLFHHIEDAEKSGYSQSKTLSRLHRDRDFLLRTLKIVCEKVFKCSSGSTLLVAAIELSCLAIVQRLVRMGFHVNESSNTPYGYPLIVATAAYSAPQTKPKTDPRAAYDLEVTVLRALSIIKVPLESGASVCDTNRISQTALHVAAVADDAAAVKLILPYKPNVNAKDIDGETRLHRAYLGLGCSETVKALVEAGADVNATAYNGSKPKLQYPGSL